MIVSVAELLMGVLVAVIPGWFLGGTLGALIAACLALLAHSLVLIWRIRRFEQWLSVPLLQLDLPWQGVWLEMSSRIQRLLRQHEKQTALHEKRLKDFLLAIQASPNGVVLLDEKSRIEWCNNTAASHLGLDAQKDHMQHIVHLV